MTTELLDPKLPIDARLPLRVWGKIKVTPDGCWEWQGCQTPLGYGRVGWEGEAQYVHRVVYAALVGEIPKGLELHHKCENPPCCNPKHLQPVTRQEHQKLSPGWSGNRKVCPKGHPLAGENLLTYKNGGGKVAHRCKICQDERLSARRKTKPGTAPMDLHAAGVCKHGHSLKDAYVKSNGSKACRACAARRAREYRSRTH